MVERWRNPYAHGGFEKGHHSTVFIHVPGAGALPIDLGSIRGRPIFSLTGASEPAMPEVFALFDKFDEWFATTQPHAYRWIDSGLSVRFDADFCSIVRSLEDDDSEFNSFLEYMEYMEYQQDVADNMDY